MEDRFKTFTVLITRIMRNIRKIKSEEVADLNLKSPHVSCLYFLYKEKALTAKELCDICEEDKAAISRSLEYLEKENYIICEVKTKKRYRSPLSLTDEGKRVASIISNKIDSILDIASEGLKEEDRVVLYKSLTLICDNLQKICDDYGG